MVSKSRVAITAGAVFLSAALAVSLFSSQQSKNVTPEQVLTWDCETVLVIYYSMDFCFSQTLYPISLESRIDENFCWVVNRLFLQHH